MNIDWEALDRLWAEQYPEDYGHFFKDGTDNRDSLANSSAVGKLGRSRRPHKPEIAGSNPACAFPVQVERSEQETGAIELSFSNSHSPGSRTTYVEKAGLIFRIDTHHHPPAFSLTNYLLADSTSLDSGATFNISSTVTSLSLCDREKKAWVFAIFPHATPIYYDDYSRRNALFPSYCSSERDMSCMVIQTKSPCSDLIKVG